MATAEFSAFADILSAALSQHHLSGVGIAQLEFHCFLYDPANVGNLISGSCDFCKSSLDIRKFSIQVLLKPNLKDFELDLTSMGNEHNCPVV